MTSECAHSAFVIGLISDTTSSLYRRNVSFDYGIIIERLSYLVLAQHNEFEISREILAPPRSRGSYPSLMLDLAEEERKREEQKRPR